MITRRRLRLEDLESELQALSPRLMPRVSQRARRMALRVDHGAQRIDLVIPRWYSYIDALRFAHANRDWISEKAGALPAAKPFADGLVLPLLGRDVTLTIEQDNSIARTRINRDGDTLHIKTGLADVTAPLVRYLKKECVAALEPLCRAKATQIGKTVKSVTVRDMTSRWGSCSHDGHLSFSWRLIFAPPVAFDYVAAHEIAHLAHFDHSRAFWKACAQLSDDMDAGRDWFDAHGHEVMAYGRN